MNDSTNKNVNTEHYPIGQDAWNRSKESREHPELYSTGYGTVDREWSNEEEETKPQSKSTKQRKRPERSESKEGFGHTVPHQPSPRSVKRDLDNIGA
ncbi:hypothetical protein BCV72DRAFT_258466 [Rhizopus microsporus var. microsporus]|uniref:Uncharacterized protein n=2 Tax=Rhizopus microsporus TaxID=58291 RepID=A0A2G4SFI5_RHIZD|nr:uncharacterized protein RHIMIDRAFT_295801 [Rhizopus microsporus ATCC 52813]ORE02119.1 hypothetical protein BCV72DRAFT_258466 [Rhizopus microsporus var. microsporus]PHZ07529.1 hypothetical protein RHIMIDRAFT_295801 [Rhizopus microsporus ATCC 52813]